MVGDELGLGKSLIQEEVIIDKNRQQYESHLTKAGFCRATMHQGLPSLDKEGKPWPRATAGVVRMVVTKPNPSGIATRHILSAPEERSPPIFPLRDKFE